MDTYNMIIEYKNFLPEQDYLYLRNFVENTEKWEPNVSPLWDKRSVNVHGLIGDKITLSVMLKLHNLTKKEIANNLNPEKEIRPELMQFQRTFETKQDQPPHSDSTGNSGEDNGTSHRKFSSLIYLNDQFSGGNLWFPNQDKEVVPKPNTLIIFPSTFEYSHGVKQVTSGVRYSILEFWMYSENKTPAESVLDLGGQNA
jgi:hypothetical protein